MNVRRGDLGQSRPESLFLDQLHSTSLVAGFLGEYCQVTRNAALSWGLLCAGAWQCLSSGA